MATLIPVGVEILVPTPLAATITTVTIAPSLTDNSDHLTLTSSLGSTTTTAATSNGNQADYNNYYQTAAYVESLSDEELAKLTNEIDNTIDDNNKAKVYINTKS